MAAKDHLLRDSNVAPGEALVAGLVSGAVARYVVRG